MIIIFVSFRVIMLCVVCIMFYDNIIMSTIACAMPGIYYAYNIIDCFMHWISCSIDIIVFIVVTINFKLKLSLSVLLWYNSFQSSIKTIGH